MSNINKLYVKIKHRYELAEKWMAINPILAPGEIGIEEDTGKFKTGDGRHSWTELNYSISQGITTKIFDGYSNEKTDATKEEVGNMKGEVFRLSQYPASAHQGEIIIVPRRYTEGSTTYVMDTPYISLRKGNKWLWVVFSDQKNKALVSSELGSFVLGASVLG
jgi:hypothetical protein